MRCARRTLVPLVVLVLVVGVGAAIDVAPASAAAVTFTVNSTLDGSDATPGNGTCATAGAVCTLRAAIEEANAGSTGNTYTIGFSVAGTIQPATRLPFTGRQITFDGSTAPGYTVAGGPVVVIDCGSQTSTTAAAFSAGSPNVTVRAFRIVNCHTGVISGTSATNLTVVGNTIGSDGTSFSAARSVDTAIGVAGAGTVIGGPTAADRNVISGFLARGILVYPTASGTTIQGNYLGTNRTGTAAIRNPAGNVDLTGPTTTGASMAIQVVGPNVAITGNVISGNPGWGMQLAGSSSGAVVKGNTIGLDAAGTTGLGNYGYGISVQEGITATIGGPGAGEGNVIADVRNVAGTAAYQGRYLITVYGATATIQGNRIGTNAAGTAAVGDAGTFAIPSIGVSSEATGGQPGEPVQASHVTLGGSAPGAGNLIAGRYKNVDLSSYPGQTVISDATVEGNLIGTNAAGTAAIAGTKIGISIARNVTATIGGTAPGAGNLVSGQETGISVVDNNAGVVIQGNKVGTNLAGTAAVANSYTGIDIANDGITPTDAGGPNIVVGGPAAGAGNVISGNGMRALLSGRPGTIQGNRIGTNAAGTAAVPNGAIGAASAAVVLNGPGLKFGGTAAGEGNLVSGNNGSGIESDQRFPVVEGNRVGTNAAGTGALPNAFYGMLFQRGAVGTIGGVGAGQANVVAFNGRAGFAVQADTHIAIRGNLIHSNDWLPIDLLTKGGANAGNGDQLPPTLTSITPGPSTTAVSGTVTSDKAGPVLVDVYATNQCQAEYGTGEAKQYLGTISVPYAGGGVTTAFSGSVANSTVGSVITATSTVAANGTSQFSACMPFTDIAVTATDSQAVAAIGDDVATLLTVTNNGPATVTGLALPIWAGGSPTSANDEGWLDAPSQGTVAASTWTVGTLAPGASASVCARGDIVRKEYPIIVDDEFEMLVPAYFSPSISADALVGVVDPFRGNNLANGSTAVGTPTARTAVCPLPTLSIGDASLVRPASGTSPMTFTVGLSKAQTRPVTVHYATANGTAVAVEDYLATSGEVTFAAGETTKTLTVAIVGNQSDEPDKAFTLALTAPKHALLADGTATGTVKANHLLQGCPPGSTSNQRFVCHLYFDALGRAPESGGFTYWVGKLNAGTPRSTMAKSYLTQSESLRKVADRAYVLYLGRHGTNAELTPWATKLKAKTVSTQDIRIAVLSTAEYFAKTGGTNTLYVQQMYRDVFRRNVDSSGLAYWVGQLDAGKTRANVATRFMAEAEGKRKIVGDIYLRFLRREPTTAEANAWVAKLAAGKTEVDVGIGLVASTEYFNRPQD